MICTCLECGAQFENGKNRVQRFCSPEPGRNMSACATRHNSRRRAKDPATRSARQTSQAKYRAKVAENPVKLEARRQYRRDYYLKNPDKVREWARRYLGRTDRVEFTGSVLGASSLSSPGRDVLVTLLDMVPRGLDPTYREEVVASAALLVLEGVPFADAVRTARRDVYRDLAPSRHHVPLQFCAEL